MLKVWIKRTSILCLFTILVFLFIGSIYQFTTTKFDEERYPPPGSLVDIGGYNLHYRISGEKGPVVILDAGLGCNSLDWALVEPEIAQFAQVLTFDRAGYGWSDPGPNPRTSEQIAKELHQLLVNAGIKGPYILVGHSFGGINMRLYAMLYPSEVSGLILVDTSHEEQLEKMPFVPYYSFVKMMRFLAYFAPTGSHRFLIPILFGDDMLNYPKELHEVRRAKQNQAKAVRSAYAELRDFADSLKQLNAARQNLKSIPIYVVYAGKVDPMVGFTEEASIKFKNMWAHLQQDIANQSDRGKLIIAEKSGHMIHWEEPELIVEAVREIILHSPSSHNSSKTQDPSYR